MNRSQFVEAVWNESYMPVFLERFVLPILVALAVGVCVFNPWKWDWNQRISLLLAVACLAYFFSYTSHHSRTQAATGASQPAATPPAQPSQQNTTTGPQSPIMPNNSGNVTINGDDSKPKEPPPKDKPK